jgi:hypothetical protein
VRFRQRRSSGIWTTRDRRRCPELRSKCWPSSRIGDLFVRAGVELIRGSASDSALDTLLERGLIERNQHQLLVTTRAFLDLSGLRHLADLPQLADDIDVKV